ncbi:MAG TPA: tryptophan-rich sensory protein [Leadbetterella sp.]|nr:tryptophan-rich sensory protein [Leadbetterella sp.]
MSTLNKKPALSILNFLLFAAVVYINTLAVTLPINGKSTGELSDQYPNLFVPAGFTFSIWGVIYLLLFIFVVYQIWVSFNKKATQKLTAQSQLLFGLTNILNISWILAWHYEKMWISVFIMIAFLSTLIVLFINNEKIKTMTFMEKITLQTPINVYLGWISVATIANITALLVTLGWSGSPLTESTWTILMLSIGAFLAVIMLFRRSNFAYALVIIWAFYGIYSKRQTSSNPEIAQTALILIVIIAFSFAYILFKNLRRKF